MPNSKVLSHCETRYFHNMKLVLSQCESKLIKELIKIELINSIGANAPESFFNSRKTKTANRKGLSMTKDTFHGLILPETQKPTDIQRTVYDLKRNKVLRRSCHAVKDDGMPCGCRSVTFDVFCHSHLRQGYGLFTLAVLQAKDGKR